MAIIHYKFENIRNLQGMRQRLAYPGSYAYDIYIYIYTHTEGEVSNAHIHCTNTLRKVMM